MADKPQIALFDLDGTLIYPGGYRAAYSATLKDLLTEMNMDALNPGPGIQEYFESLSVNSEWDMLSITIAILLEAAYQAAPQLTVAQTLNLAMEEVRLIDTKDLEIDYIEQIRKLGPYFQQAETPSLGVLAATNGMTGQDIFPRLRDTTLLVDLLSETRDVKRSLAVRRFQTYTLGGDLFYHTYGIIPPFNCDSYLQRYDRVLISDETSRNVLEMSERGDLYISILTCRPSRPPKEVEIRQVGLTTESDIALSLLKMSQTPLIGYGSLQYLANHHGTRADYLIKPSPVQALAAIGAAWTGEERRSLEWAYQVYRASIVSPPLRIDSEVLKGLVPPLPAHFHLHVFEDSPTGIMSAHDATRILERCGLAVEFDAWGIAQDGDKQAALILYGADVYPTFDDAFKEFIQIVA